MADKVFKILRAHSFASAMRKARDPVDQRRKLLETHRQRWCPSSNCRQGCHCLQVAQLLESGDVFDVDCEPKEPEAHHYAGSTLVPPYPGSRCSSPYHRNMHCDTLHQCKSPSEPCCQWQVTLIEDRYLETLKECREKAIRTRDDCRGPEGRTR